MDSSDSLKIDENLARLLAAYDQSIDGGDAGPVTIHAPLPPDLPLSAPTERPVTPLRPEAPNEGSLGEVLPDSNGSGRMRQAFPGTASGPHRVGRFELRRQLGKGGCGIVFLAYDPKLEREVALKIPRPEMLLNSDAKRRLMREAQAAAEFDHPNLVPVFDTGEIGPLCFIATAFCPGQTLAEWLDRQAFPVPVRQAARLVATVAEAVQHAHDRGVLHRDLKPNNVILQEMKVEENDETPPGAVQLRGDYFVPRLVDFGLAKLAERGGPSETATRQILGTPKYMAPEQAQARREDIGPPADVYGLGIILYEMLTGRAPYDGASDVEVLRQAIEGKPAAPRSLRPDVPRDLEAICLKAMARVPGERYRSAIELADDLRRFLDGRPTVARPLAWPGRAWRWLRRNDQMVAIVTLAITVVFVTGLGSLNWYESWKLRKANEKALNEQASRNRAEQEAAYSRHMRNAFLAWRGGNANAAGDALDSARGSAGALMEQPDFTHDYLRRLVQSDQLTIVCPAGPVTALAVSPDGTRLASGHADGTAAVWDRATGRQLGAVKAHESRVTHVAFALSGGMLVTVGKQAGSSSAMLGWEVGKGGALAPARGDRRELGKDVHCCAVSPDGRTVFAGGDRGLLLKRDLNDAAPVVARKGEPGKPSVTAIAVARDGNRVITADAAGTVLCWTAGLQPGDVRAYEFRREVSALAANYAGLPAVGFGGGDVWLVEPVCHPLVFSAGSRVHWIAATETTFALNSVPGRVRLGGSELATGDLGAVRAGAFSPDGKSLFTGSEDGVIRSWNVAADTRDRGATLAGRVAAVGVSSDGAQFVVADEHHVTRHGAEGIIEGGPRPLVALRVQDNGTVRGVAFEKSAVVVHDLSGNTSTEVFRARLPDGRAPAAAALTPDGLRLAVGDDAGRVTVWSLADGAGLGTYDTGRRRPVRSVGFSDDGGHVAAPTAGGVGVWAVGNPQVVADVATDDQAVFRILAPGRLATAGRDGVVRMWGFDGKEQAALYGHVGRITALAASPDGRTLVSGGATGEVKFWDLRTGQELLGLRRHSTAVTVIEFAASSRFLVTAGEGQIAAWDARE